MTTPAIKRHARIVLLVSTLVLAVGTAATANSISFADSADSCKALFANSDDAVAKVVSAPGITIWQQLAGEPHKSWDFDSVTFLITLSGLTSPSPTTKWHASDDITSGVLEHYKDRDDDRHEGVRRVPEPSSMALFGAGLIIAAGGLLRRRSISHGRNR
jgi:hypothetical protein